MQTTLNTRYQQVEAIICDMDNTLFDFMAAKWEACRCVVDYLGIGDPEALCLQFLNGTHGFEDHRNIRDYLEGLDAYQPGTYEVCCHIYEGVKLDLIEPYPGVEETLRCLQNAGIRLAIATDAESVQANRRLTRAGLIDFFEVVVTPDVSGKRKPEPDSLLCAIRQLEAVPEEAMMVGDSPGRDIAPGRQIGMVTAFAAYGDWRQSRTGEIAADIILAEFSDILGHVGLPDR